MDKKLREQVINKNIESHQAGKSVREILISCFQAGYDQAKSIKNISDKIKISGLYANMRDGKEIRLTFGLLKTLRALSKERFKSAEELKIEIWGLSRASDTSIRVSIAKIRELLGKHSIISKTHLGYRLASHIEIL